MSECVCECVCTQKHHMNSYKCMKSMTASDRYLEQELQDGVVAVETEELGHGFGVQDLKSSV